MQSTIKFGIGFLDVLAGNQQHSTDDHNVSEDFRVFLRDCPPNLTGKQGKGGNAHTKQGQPHNNGTNLQGAGDQLRHIPHHARSVRVRASKGSFTWISCVNYDADDQELDAWGLDEDTAVKVVLTYQPASSTADSLRYTSYSSLRSAEICSVDWNTVDRLEVTVDGTTNTISFDEQEQETTADGGDTVTETVPLYTWNGTEMDTTSVESMLDAMDALTATGDFNGENQGELLASFTIYRDSTYFTELTLELYAYDTSSCLAVFNGGRPRLVDRSAVTTLTDALDNLFTEE